MMGLSKAIGRAAALCVLSLGIAAQAGATSSMVCTFNLECFDAETCIDTQYEVTITHKEFTAGMDEMDASAQWQDDATIRTVFVRQRTDVTFGMWAENDGRIFGRILKDPNGAARYVYMSHEGPFTITYHGTCEGKP